ncbi:MAG: hypothetical protein H7Y11_13910 [Armatimonadetes bacterium]|nr:hypothetical protein [Anaerolineae bacterium]
MTRLLRRNGAWFGILGAFTALAFIAGSPAALVLAGLLGFALVATLLQVRTPRPVQLAGVVQQVTGAGARVSSQAKEATTRASSRGYAPNPRLMLMDLGLIASAQTDDGMVMRRTRSISKDDDGVRPFVVLHIAPSEADRNVKLRFEMIDQNGREAYIHEMSVYLRDGELNILADHHLPLLSNRQVEGSGEWDLRVYLDGSLMAIHSFGLTPSDDERANRLGGATPARRYVMPDSQRDVADAPVSLEDLLRGQANQQRRQ